MLCVKKEELWEIIPRAVKDQLALRDIIGTGLVEARGPFHRPSILVIRLIARDVVDHPGFIKTEFVQADQVVNPEDA